MILLNNATIVKYFDMKVLFCIFLLLTNHMLSNRSLDTTGPQTPKNTIHTPSTALQTFSDTPLAASDLLPDQNENESGNI